MKKIDGEKAIIFLGDHHGNWQFIFDIIRDKKIKDCCILCVGDGGEGFLPKDKQLKQFEKLNKSFKEKNIYYKSIRGNHSDPFYFQGKDRVVFDNFELIEDYTVLQYGEKTIQFIGGAISIDRTGRKEGVSYWEEEAVKYEPEKCQKVDILVTHTTPSWCFPQTFNEMVYGWANEDANLIGDLSNERAIINELFEKCNPSLHLYGHFHSSWTEEINGCKHKLLDINEMWSYE